jgi:hypothetical protein
MVVTPVTPVGDGFALQWAFRSHCDLHGLAVDRTSTPSRGSLYITWHDGRNLSQVDPLADPGCELGAPRYWLWGCLHHAFDDPRGDVVKPRADQ